MAQYIDKEGSVVTATQLTGPCILNTALGEVCGSEGEWHVIISDGKPYMFTDEAFRGSFTALEV